MSHITRSLIAGGIVVLGVGSIVAGLVIRDNQDLGSSHYLTDSSSAQVGGLIASRDGAEVPADKYFALLSETLKREYVDSVTDDAKLASGSVRGMVASLNDPNSVYMDAKEFAAYQRAVSGHYEGIGAELSLEDSTAPASTGQGSKGEDSDADTALNSPIDIPKLVVVGLTPDGPAAKAGVQIGDAVEYVGGRWVMQAEPVNRLRDLAKKVQERKAPISDLIALRKELRPRFEKSVLPLKAKDELSLGDSGSVDIVWLRAGKELKTSISRAKSDLPAFGPDAQGVIHLSFAPGDADRLKQAITGKSGVTIDLRGSTIGDFPTMKACLAVVAPKGEYGTLQSNRQGKTRPLTVVAGNQTPPKMTLIVDKSTRGPAEIFAIALQAKKLATLQGGSMSGHRFAIEVVALPDGSGYTLVTGVFQAAPLKAASNKPRPVAFLYREVEV